MIYSFDDAVFERFNTAIGMNALAQELEVGRSKFYDFLRKQGVLDRFNSPTPEYADKGYFIDIGNALIPLIKATAKGANFIFMLVKEKYEDKKYKGRSWD